MLQLNTTKARGKQRANQDNKWGAMKHRLQFGHLTDAEPVVKPTREGRFLFNRECRRRLTLW